MRHVALLGLALTLSGCGYQTWDRPPFIGATNPNLPTTDSENVQRAEGRGTDVTPLTPEAGDIWPGPIQPPPTLEDLEKTGRVTPGAEQPVPGSPLNKGGAALAPEPSPNPSTGSSSVPGNAQPPLATLPQPSPPVSSNRPVTPPPHGQAGQIIQTPNGAGVTTGGSTGYSTMTTPGGGQAIVVPNGNGTSTVIHSDGRVETIPTGK